MTRVLLVPDLPLERWPSMDRYAHRLHDWLESTDPGFEVRLAASIGDLTRDRANGRTSGGYPRWWAQDVDPTRSEEHTSELQSRLHLVCRLLLEKKKRTTSSRPQ